MSRSRVHTSASRRFAGLVGLALSASVLATAAPVGAQSADTKCFGFTAATAEAAGFNVMLGTSGVDVLAGGNTTRDFILGGDGDDILSGAGAGDIICGGPGNDVINAGDGDDQVHGGSGADEINLGAGNDFGQGAYGADRIVGGTGNDTLLGMAGADRLSGEAGNDRLEGRQGEDTIFGGEGEDLILGQKGSDRLAGGPGVDRILGGRGGDIISGDGGNDVIFGNRGPDRLDGDAGSDQVTGGGGDDVCDADDGDDLASCELGFGDPAPEPEPEDTAPPGGGPVPANRAPQGVNSFGWPLLTQVGLDAMLMCESTNNHAINTGNGFYGGVQWLPQTWNAAAEGAGFGQYVGVLPHLVPADVQDQVTFSWWERTRPNTQWPTCHRRALDAMNVLAP